MLRLILQITWLDLYPKYHKLIQFTGRNNPIPYYYDFSNLYSDSQIQKIQNQMLTEMWSLFRATYEVLKPFETPEEAIKSSLALRSRHNICNQKVGELCTGLDWQLTMRPHIFSLSIINVKINITDSNETNWNVIHVGLFILFVFVSVFVIQFLFVCCFIFISGRFFASFKIKNYNIVYQSCLG